ncbi:hypothetical protein LSH36_161g04002 [Paralvinella palmiformis]|uniref:Uncharacterized protein n=1 Tax=Paralvinella palmiformis TaxID=53620 RepID=A0AAD9N9E2_9ANNE|nr:hypothetical protein LSH36_161g04002 [Paralvinella palmiformis]
MGNSIHRWSLIAAIVILVIVFFVLDLSLERSRNQPAFSKEDRTLHVTERLPHAFELGGYLFNESGRSHGLRKRVTTSLVHSFSPYIEREAAKRFIDPPHDNVYFANSPAITWYHGQLVLVARIWLDREKYEPKNDWPANHFADNWLYTQRFNHRMEPITEGAILGIPSPKQWWVGDGPIEPRLFTVGDRLFVSFNEAMAFHPKKFMDFTVFWDMLDNYPIIPRIKGGSPMINASEKDEMPRDKHWMSLIDGDQLYFVHNLDPFRVMHCSLDGFCRFIHDESVRTGLNFKDHVSHLRGGTPFELYRYPYYIGVAHSTMYKRSNHRRFYTAHIVVVSVKPFRIVYVSNDLQIHPQIYQTTPMVRSKYIDDGFIFPVGNILEDKDTMSVGVHVNDYSSEIIRLRGLESLMDKIIDLDQVDSPTHGPPVGYIQQHTHDTMEKVAKLKFLE